MFWLRYSSIGLLPLNPESEESAFIPIKLEASESGTCMPPIRTMQHAKRARVPHLTQELVALRTDDLAQFSRRQPTRQRSTSANKTIHITIAIAITQ